MLRITYDGANFQGWQKQKNARTVEEEIESAIKIVTGEDVKLVGSGRTDAGVNAISQYAHFDIDKTLDEKKFVYQLNGITPHDVVIFDMFHSPLHARYSSKKKTYLYKCYLSQYDLPLKTKMLRLNEDIDLKLMKKCAKKLVGEHDYKNFCASNSGVKSTTRKIYFIKIKKRGDDVDIFVCGNGFLYKMVRNIVGLLIEVGMHRVSVSEFYNIAFRGGGKKFTAKAEALYLYDVEYQGGRK